MSVFEYFGMDFVADWVIVIVVFGTGNMDHVGQFVL